MDLLLVDAATAVGLETNGHGIGDFNVFFLVVGRAGIAVCIIFGDKALDKRDQGLEHAFVGVFNSLIFLAVGEQIRDILGDGIKTFEFCHLFFGKRVSNLC